MTITLEERLKRELEHGATRIAAEQPDFGWTGPTGSIRRERRIAFLTKGLPRNAHVLEVGSGTGLQTMALLEKLDDLTSIDVSPDLLERAKARAPGAKYLVMDAHKPEFPPETFDAIVGVSILHHLDWSLALKNYLPLLKPGGVVRFSEPNLMNPQIWLQKNIPYIKRKSGDSPDEYAFTRFHIAKVLKDAGFVDINVIPYEFLHPRTPEKWIPFVKKLEAFASATPLLKEIGGSLLIEARKAVK